MSVAQWEMPRSFAATFALVLFACFANVGTARADAVPVISGTPPTTASVGQLYSFRPTGQDPDGNVLVWAITNKPSWASFSGTTGELRGTPTAAGTWSSITIVAWDGRLTGTLKPFPITVSGGSGGNAPPTISGAPATSVTVGGSYSFRPTASDPDGNPLTYAVTNRPGWASFNTSTGQLSGVPAAGNVGMYSSITITVSDGRGGSASLAAFALQVNAASGGNRPPVISGTPSQSVKTGQLYSFRPTASDPDGNTLGFSIQSRPSWASFNTSTGELSGTPTSANVGTAMNIVISVSDGTVSTSLPKFQIVVSPGSAPPTNHAPTISGTPSTSAPAGSAYAFTPTASDGDGDSLTFSAQNLPSWATVSSATGRISGTPSAANVGTSSNIVIRVSDGRGGTAQLAAFAITVTDVSNGAATLSWTAPTANTDGSTLTNLAGYRIFYGTSASSLTQSVQIATPGTATYVVTNLAPATWYFSVRAYNSAGAESSNSNVASKVVN